MQKGKESYGSSVTLAEHLGHERIQPGRVWEWRLATQRLRKARCVQSSKEAPLVQRGVAAGAAGGIEGT